MDRRCVCMLHQDMSCMYVCMYVCMAIVPGRNVDTSFFFARHKKSALLKLNSICSFLFRGGIRETQQQPPLPLLGQSRTQRVCRQPNPVLPASQPTAAVKQPIPLPKYTCFVSLSNPANPRPATAHPVTPRPAKKKKRTPSPTD